MLQEMAHLLEPNVDPAVWDGLLELTRALEQHDAVLYKDRLHGLYMIANTLERMEVVDTARAIIDDQVSVLLDQMRIRLNQGSVSLEQLAGILQVLLFKPNDLDEQMLRAIEQAEDDIEALEEVLAIALGIEAMELFGVVEEVHHDTIKAIEDRLTKNLSYREDTAEGVTDVIHTMHRHQALVGEIPTIAMESLHTGTSVFSDCEELIARHSERLSELDDARLADELISFVLLSGVAPKAVKDEVMFFVEASVDDLTRVQRIHRHCQMRLTEIGCV